LKPHHSFVNNLYVVFLGDFVSYKSHCSFTDCSFSCSKESEAVAETLFWATFTRIHKSHFFIQLYP